MSSFKVILGPRFRKRGQSLKNPKVSVSNNAPNDAVIDEFSAILLPLPHLHIGTFFFIHTCSA